MRDPRDGAARSGRPVDLYSTGVAVPRLPKPVPSNAGRRSDMALRQGKRSPGGVV